MKLYLEQNRKELFENTTYVCETSFQGIQMLVKDTENKINTATGYRIPRPGENNWINVIRPRKFAEKH
ncbi:hypothetical protein OMD49_27795 [Bacillus anthracis]|nr:hypothetical protein [Bacillus anthracis]